MSCTAKGRLLFCNQSKSGQKSVMCRNRANAFENNYNLKNIKLPESGLLLIGDDCFSHCLNMEEIVIPRSVFSIGSAFTDCWRLAKVIMRTENVRVNKSAFRDCSSNLTIEYAECAVTAKHFFNLIRHNNVKRSVRIIKKKYFAGKVRGSVTTRD